METLFDATGYSTDKLANDGYLANYEEFLRPLADREIRLLEIGVHEGGSLLLWRDFFPRGTIAGLDVRPVNVPDETGRIRVYQGRQQDQEVLDRIAAEVAPAGFDIVIDDGSHLGELTRRSFRHLFDRHLKPGGIYVVEDWGTGYWADWPDGRPYRDPGSRPGSRLARAVHALARSASRGRAGRLAAAVAAWTYPRRFPSHDHGMVGLLKQWVDECGLEDATHPEHAAGPVRSSSIRRIVISLGHAFLFKA